jgi:hypothetical protein
MEHLKDKIQEGIKEFQGNTMFLANYLKCNLVVRSMLAPHIDEEGKLEGTGLFVIVRMDIPDMECHIGMGQGPTYSVVKL